MDAAERLKFFLEEIGKLIFDKSYAPIIIRIEEKCHSSTIIASYDRYTKMRDRQLVEEGFTIYKLVCNRYGRQDSKLVNYAAHEVRHQLQHHHKQTVNLSLWHKIKRFPLKIWGPILRLLLSRIFVDLSNKEERDAYLIGYLAEKDYKKYQNLKRIAEIVRI